MLLELHIENFAIIDVLHLRFGSHLNIFTGETGAGKSIIIDAVKLLLGDRAVSDVVRSGARESVVEASFDINGNQTILALLQDAGLTCSNELIVKRVIARSGRNRVFINNSMATLSTLSLLASSLIDIYGQSEHQSLTGEDEHLEILDTFICAGSLREEVSSRYRKLGSMQRTLDGLIVSGVEQKEREEFLKYRLDEIDSAFLKQGEEEDLLVEKEKLVNFESLFAAASEADDLLYSSDDSLLGNLERLLERLKRVERFDPLFSSRTTMLETAIYQIDDVATFFRDYAGSMNYDGERLEKIRERLNIISKLKKKYGSSVEEILKKRDELSDELRFIEDLGGRIDMLKKEVEDERKLVLDRAMILSEERAGGAARLMAMVGRELYDLGMKTTRFEIRVVHNRDSDGLPRVGEKGIDRVAFYLSPNPGEDLRPLARVASGGELSRIMLAIKHVTSAGRVPTVIFDEIDAGIGGAVADTVGRKIKEVSEDQQVICITHMPQIAVYGDQHYSVSKTNSGGRTFTSVSELDDDSVIDEVARMLGSSAKKESAVGHAREMLYAARSANRERGADGKKSNNK